MPRRKPLAQRNNKKKPSEDKLKQHKQKRFAVWRPSGPNRGFFPPFQLTSVHPSIMIHATEEDRIYHVFPYDERMNVPPGARVNAMPGALCDGRVVILVPNPIKGDNQDQDLHLEAMAVMWRPRVAGAPEALAHRPRSGLSSLHSGYSGPVHSGSRCLCPFGHHCAPAR